MNQNSVFAATPPITAKIPYVQAQTGISRSGLYRAAKEGKIRLIKFGRTTLVDLDSVRAYLASLPTYSPKA